MNQKLIKTEKATLLLLNLQNNTTDVLIEFNDSKYASLIQWSNGWGNRIKLPLGNWQPLGFANEVSEEVAKTIVDDLVLTYEYYVALEKKVNTCNAEGLILPTTQLRSLLEENNIEPIENVYLLKLVI